MNTKNKLAETIRDKWIELLREKWGMNVDFLKKLNDDDFKLIYTRGMEMVADKYPLLVKHKKTHLGLSVDLIEEIEETIHWNLSYDISPEETLSNCNLTNDQKTFIMDSLELTKKN